MAEVFRGSEDTIDCCFCSIDKKKLAEPTQSVSNDKSFRVNSEGNTSPVSFNTSATCVRQLCTRFRTFTPSPPSSSISRASQTFAISIRTIIDPLYPIFPPSTTAPTRAIDGAEDGHRKNRLEFRPFRLSTSISIPIPPFRPRAKPIERFNTRGSTRLSRTCYHVLPFPIKDLSPVFDGGWRWSNNKFVDT